MHLQEKLTKLLKISSFEPPVIFCIGSDRVTGDCFGPLVGEFLINNYNIDTFVYGTLTSPITALNIVKTYAFVRARHPKAIILAIDSALGLKEDVGHFRVIADGIFPGAATGKKLPKIGDIALTATVAPMGPGIPLYGVQLGFVNTMAKLGARMISECLGEIKANKDYAPESRLTLA